MVHRDVAYMMFGFVPFLTGYFLITLDTEALAGFHDGAELRNVERRNCSKKNGDRFSPSGHTPDTGIDERSKSTIVRVDSRNVVTT